MQRYILYLDTVRGTSLGRRTYAGCGTGTSTFSPYGAGGLLMPCNHDRDTMTWTRTIHSRITASWHLVRACQLAPTVCQHGAGPALLLVAAGGAFPLSGSQPDARNAATWPVEGRRLDRRHPDSGEICQLHHLCTGHRCQMLAKGLVYARGPRHPYPKRIR